MKLNNNNNNNNMLNKSFLYLIIIVLFLLILIERNESKSFFSNINLHKSRVGNENNKIFAYRMLQYKNGSTINGPTKASLSSSLMVYQKQFYQSTNYEGKSVIVDQSDFNIDTIIILNSKKVDSIIVKISTEPFQSSSSPLLNHDENNNDNNENNDNIDKLLLSEIEYDKIYTSNLKFKIKVPIYFVKKEEYEELIKYAYHQISKDKIITPKQQNDFKFLISLGLPEIINNPNSYNFQTTLKCKQSLLNSSQSSQPQPQPKTIVILASYDSYSIIPALSGEINNHGNSIAIFELLRVFSMLYSNANTQPISLNLVFTLVGASSLNEFGVRRWIDQQSKSFLNSIDHVLCIDSIGMKSYSTFKNNNNEEEDDDENDRNEKELINDENKLYLQISKPLTKSLKIKNLVENYQFSAKNDDINLTIIQKKIDISIPKINFKHEIFSRKHIHAMTITQKQFSTPTTNGILSTNSKLSLPILKRNTKIIASSLLSYIYNISNNNNNNYNNDLSKLLEFSLDINEQSMLSMYQVLLNTNLMFPYIQPLKTIEIINNNNNKKQTIINNQNNNNKIDLINGIELIFKEYNDKFNYVIDVFQTGTSEIGNTVEFYQPTKATMSFIQIKPISFDVLIFTFSSIYLFFFYCWINNYNVFMFLFKNIIKRNSKKNNNKK
ncbi:hypothetical protein ACTFIW_009506 [Dictyostelium discoideum]